MPSKDICTLWLQAIVDFASLGVIGDTGKVQRRESQETRNFFGEILCSNVHSAYTCAKYIGSSWTMMTTFLATCHVVVHNFQTNNSTSPKSVSNRMKRFAPGPRDFRWFKKLVCACLPLKGPRVDMDPQRVIHRGNTGVFRSFTTWIHIFYHRYPIGNSKHYPIFFLNQLHQSSKKFHWKKSGCWGIFPRSPSLGKTLKVFLAA